MSEIANTETAPVSEKPVKENDEIQFPPFPGMPKIITY